MSKRDHDLDDELRFHLEKQIQQNLARGMTPEEARYAALRSFGGVAQVQEACRDLRPLRWLHSLLQDLRYGWRVLRRSPALTAFAVLTLALGIGAATTIFSVFYAVLLRPLPFRDPDRIFSILEGHRRRPTGYIGVSPAELHQWRTHSRVLEDLTASTYSSVTLRLNGQTERFQALWVHANFFDFIGRRAIVGRTFLPEDDQPGAPCLMLLGHGLWRGRFGADPEVVGRQVVANDKPCAIVGVTSPGTRTTGESGLTGEEALWMLAPVNPNNKAHGYQAWARLKPGIDWRRAAEELAALTLRDPIHTADTQGIRITALSQYVAGDMRPQLLLLLGAVGFLLLLGCANVANLLLVRTAARAREIAVRRALGAGRWRLLRQLLTESLLLGLLGGLLGALLAVWGVKAVVAVAPAAVPRLEEVRLDLGALIFSLAVSILAAILAGLAPALEGSRTGLNETLQETARGLGGARSQRLGRLLVAAEVALALVLLIGAGLTIHSFVRLLGEGPGLQTKDVLAFHVSLPEAKYLETLGVYPGAERVNARKMRERPQLAAFRQQLFNRIRSLPGVELAAATDFVPLSCVGMGWAFIVEGRPPQPGQSPPLAGLQPVTTDYFRLLDIPIVKGRVFTEGDHENSPPVIVIDETLARRYFPGEDPIGRRLLLAEYDQWRPNELWGGVPTFRRPHEVIGVVRKVKHCGFDRAEEFPAMYIPFGQRALEFPIGNTGGGATRTSITFLLGAPGPPPGLWDALRRAAWEADKDAVVVGARSSPLEQFAARWLAPRRFYLALLSFFGALALVLAAVGIYGVISYSVSRRTHEIGVRLALGARAADVHRLVLSQALAPIAGGTLAGLGAAWGLTRFLSSVLYGIKPTDAATFSAAAAVLVLVAVAASSLPARRATRVDPVDALRHE
jgi:putative ABC transport system permease protein